VSVAKEAVTRPVGPGKRGHGTLTTGTDRPGWPDEAAVVGPDVPVVEYQAAGCRPTWNALSSGVSTADHHPTKRKVTLPAFTVTQAGSVTTRYSMDFATFFSLPTFSRASQEGRDRFG
jgi:hypothetical protein